MNNSGTYGVDVAAPVPEDPSKDTLSRQGFSYFYIKTWYCPSGYGFDITTDLCFLCTLSNCLTCATASTCAVCD